MEKRLPFSDLDPIYKVIVYFTNRHHKLIPNAIRTSPFLDPVDRVKGPISKKKTFITEVLVYYYFELKICMLPEEQYMLTYIIRFLRGLEHAYLILFGCKIIGRNELLTNQI